MDGRLTASSRVLDRQGRCCDKNKWDQLSAQPPPLKDEGVGRRCFALASWDHSTNYVATRTRHVQDTARYGVHTRGHNPKKWHNHRLKGGRHDRHKEAGADRGGGSGCPPTSTTNHLCTSVLLSENDRETGRNKKRGKSKRTNRWTERPLAEDCWE